MIFNLFMKLYLKQAALFGKKQKQRFIDDIKQQIDEKTYILMEKKIKNLYFVTCFFKASLRDSKVVDATRKWLH